MDHHTIMTTAHDHHLNITTIVVIMIITIIVAMITFIGIDAPAIDLDMPIAMMSATLSMQFQSWLSVGRAFILLVIVMNRQSQSRHARPEALPDTASPSPSLRSQTCPRISD